MTPEFSNNQREVLEAKLTALLLGELPAQEAFALGRAIEQDAELAKTFERLKKTIGLITQIEAPATGEIASPAPMKMSTEKREALFRQFKTVKPKAFAESKRRNVGMLEAVAVFALLAILAAMLLPALSKAKSKAQRIAKNSHQVALGTWADHDIDLQKVAEPAAAATPAATDTNGRAHESQRGVQGPNAPARTGAGALALNDDLSITHQEDVPSKKLPEGAFSGGGGGGGGPRRLTRNGTSAIVLPASNETAQQNAPAPNVTIAARFADVTQHDWFGAEGSKIDPASLGRDTSITNSWVIANKQDAFNNVNGGLAAPLGETDTFLAGKDFSSYNDLNRNRRAEPIDAPKISVAPIDPATGLPQASPQVAVDPATGLPMPIQSAAATASVEQRYYRVNPDLVAQKLKESDASRVIENTNAAVTFGAISGDIGGIRSVTRTNAMLALQDGVREMLANDGVTLDSTKGETVYYDDRSGTITVNGTSENHGKMRSLAGSFGNASSSLSTTAGTIVLPPNSVDLSLNFTPSEPTWNYKKGTVYADRGVEQPRGANALTQTELGDEARSKAASNDYALEIAGYGNVRTDQRKLAEAEHKLDEMKRFDQLLSAKEVTEGIDSRLPKSTMVEIMDEARPAAKPSSTLWDKLTGKPAQYESKVRIAVNRDTADIAASQPKKTEPVYDPYFTQTEFETIGSTQILGRVVSNLNLGEKWAKNGKKLSNEEAITRLKRTLDLKAAGSHIELGVKDQKADEAAKIANAVAKSYREFRQQQANSLGATQMAMLHGQIADQEKKIREQQSVVDQLRHELRVPEGKPSPDAPWLVAHNSTPAQVDRKKMSEDKPLPKPATPPPTPQPEIETATNPFSTFSLNVSDVSFKLAAASLEQGALPEPVSIRSEEFINAFDYRDPEPPANVPVAFASERAQYPFAQNRDLLRFSIKAAARGREAGRPLNLVLLVDNSGSMERADRVSILRESLRVLAAQLKKEDRLSIVTFARAPHLRVDGISGDQAASAVDQVIGLTPEGGTNLEEGMNLAYQTASRHYLTNGVNRVVLMTDGAANLGDVTAESLKQKVESNRKQGIALDCFGIGWEGYNDDLLEVLSRNGDGRYGFINTSEGAASEFASQLAGALHVAASDVKVQVEFNPKRTIAYRQIGYAKHQLTKEQFRDNTVDAAEIGAAEAGNALYVIQTNPNGEGPIATVRVRFKVPGTSDYREHEWQVAYTGAAAALDQASPAMRLAATASAFSEWLAISPYATEVTSDALLKYISGVPEVYGADGKPKKLEWMIRQAKAISGK